MSVMSDEKAGTLATTHPVHKQDLEIIDETALASCGYKQEFKRELSLFSCFSVSFSVVGILPSIATTLYYADGLAGRAGMTWGFLLGYTGIHAVALSMAEVASSMPTSGGNYYAVAVLAPPKIAPFLSWCVGWSNYIGLVLGCPAVNYGNASMIAALASFRDPTYQDTNAKRFGISIALTLACDLMAALPTKWMGRINSGGTWLQVICLLAIIIGVPAGCKNTPKFVSNHEAWGVITNGTDHLPDGIAILFSFLTAIWTMSGYDAPFHLSEEVSNAQTAVPRAIAFTSTVGGIFGWSLLLVVAYTAVDVTEIAGSVQPFIGWLIQVVDTKTATAFGALTIITGFMCAQGCAVSASRLAFAYGRDRVLPFSRYVGRMNEKTSTPINAICLNFFVQSCTLCLIFAGAVAIGAIFSITACGMYFSFVTPIFLKVSGIAGERWKDGPWTLGKFSRPVNAYACAWTFLMIPIMNLPYYTGSALTPDTMNWTCVVWGGPMVLAIATYAIWARKWYRGPVINLDHLPGTTIDVDPKDLKLDDVRAIVRSATREEV